MTNELFLADEHRTALEKGSRISPEVICARRYETITIKARLQQLGFGVNQRCIPTLSIPIYDVNGQIVLYHHRPDTPRILKGKPVKYEFPAGAKMAIDVHPFIRDKVRDPSVPLFITEGVKKADSAISQGLCCIALTGVWNWRGANEYGGLTALPDWEGIALKDRKGNGRKVYIVFDSDVMEKQPVYQALCRLASFLRSRGV